MYVGSKIIISDPKNTNIEQFYKTSKQNCVPLFNSIHILAEDSNCFYEGFEFFSLPVKYKYKVDINKVFYLFRWFCKFLASFEFS